MNQLKRCQFILIFGAFYSPPHAKPSSNRWYSTNRFTSFGPVNIAQKPVYYFRLSTTSTSRFIKQFVLKVLLDIVVLSGFRYLGHSDKIGIDIMFYWKRQLCNFLSNWHWKETKFCFQVHLWKFWVFVLFTWLWRRFLLR